MIWPKIKALFRSQGKAKSVGFPAYTVLPSFPAPNFTELIKVMDELKGEAGSFQVDIVDGQFAPFVSWPFSEGGVVDLNKLKTLAIDYELEIDCMVNNPLSYLDIIVETGFKRMIVHMGSMDNMKVAAKVIKNKSLTVGLAATSDVEWDLFLETAAIFDYIQVMGIKEVGKQGQPFDERTYNTVRRLREIFPQKDISVDGGVNEKTIPGLIQAGANRLAPGSAITKASDSVAAYKHLVSLLPH